MKQECLTKAVVLAEKGAFLLSPRPPPRRKGCAEGVCWAGGMAAPGFEVRINRETARGVGF